jgi:hypothetical protein
MVQLGEKAVYPVGHRNLLPAMTDGGGTLPIRATVTVSYPFENRASRIRRSRVLGANAFAPREAS